MHKAGRYTAALLLVCVGAAVIADRYMGTQWTSLLIEWWPVLFIALGVEYIILNMKYGESERQLKLDFIGVILAVVISAAVVGTQSAETVRNWFGNVDINDAVMAFSEAEGRKFDKGTTDISLAAGVERIEVINPYGNIALKKGSSDKLQIQSTVFVALEDEQAANDIASQALMEHHVQGNKLIVQVEAKEYGSGLLKRRKTRTDMVVSIPPQAFVSMKLDSTNGNITADQLKFKDELKAATTNGKIQLTSVQAPELDLESTNAQIVAADTAGKMTIETTNGGAEISKHQGNVEVRSTNGNLAFDNVNGAMDAETTNGSIKIKEVPALLKANTTNGTVDVSSRTVNGPWDIETGHGSITLALPANGDYSVNGEGLHGAIRSSLPLQINDSKIKGNIGGGKHKIEISTSGEISIKKAD